MKTVKCESLLNVKFIMKPPSVPHNMKEMNNNAENIRYFWRKDAHACKMNKLKYSVNLFFGTDHVTCGPTVHIYRNTHEITGGKPGTGCHDIC